MHLCIYGSLYSTVLSAVESTLGLLMDNEAFWKVFIPTVYCHLGNKHDIWIYNNDELTKDLQKVFSTLYFRVTTMVSYIIYFYLL